jgi:uncharacterized membrane protein YoaK (UPF0700 family)
LLVALTVVAGSVDALSFVILKVLTYFMSGRILLLG